MGGGTGSWNDASISDALESLSDRDWDEVREEGDRARGDREWRMDVDVDWTDAEIAIGAEAERCMDGGSTPRRFEVGWGAAVGSAERAFSVFWTVPQSQSSTVS